MPLIGTKSQDLSPLIFNHCALRRLFCSSPQVLGVNAAGHVTVAWLWSLRMPSRLLDCEQPAQQPSSGLGIAVLTTSRAAQPHSSAQMLPSRELMKLEVF